jgi:hypothetical protein
MEGGRELSDIPWEEIAETGFAEMSINHGFSERMRKELSRENSKRNLLLRQGRPV